MEEFSNEWERIIDCSGTVRAGLDDWLTQTLQAERQKREEAVEAERERSVELLDVLKSAMEHSTDGIDRPQWNTYQAALQALTQPNNPK